jgi:hypothetical protein
MVKTVISKIWNYLTMPGEILNQSRYLAQSVDVADLERRMKDVQRAKTRFQHL